MYGKVLIADDDRNILIELVEMLGNMGFQAKGVNDGLEAIAVLAMQPIDILITDLKMPRVGGLELIRRVREIHPDIPILAITGFVSPETMIDAVGAGATEVLAKPINPIELKEILARFSGPDEVDPWPDNGTSVPGGQNFSV